MFYKALVIRVIYKKIQIKKSCTWYFFASVLNKHAEEYTLLVYPYKKFI